MIIRIVIIIVKITRMGQIIIGGCNDFTHNNNHYNYNDSYTMMLKIVTSTSILYLRSYINLLQIRDHLLHLSYFLILQIPMCNIFTIRPVASLFRETTSTYVNNITSFNLFNSTNSQFNSIQSLSAGPISSLMSLLIFKITALLMNTLGALAAGVQVVSLMWLRTALNYQYRCSTYISTFYNVHNIIYYFLNFLIY